MLNWIKNKWEAVKAWFKHSETIFLARLEAFVGFIVAGAASIDWSPLLAMDFTNAVDWNQFTVLGAVMFVKGLITEWARRRNATDL